MESEVTAEIKSKVGQIDLQELQTLKSNHLKLKDELQSAFRDKDLLEKEVVRMDAELSEALIWKREAVAIRELLDSLAYQGQAPFEHLLGFLRDKKSDSYIFQKMSVEDVIRSHSKVKDRKIGSIDVTILPQVNIEPSKTNLNPVTPYSSDGFESRALDYRAVDVRPIGSHASNFKSIDPRSIDSVSIDPREVEYRAVDPHVQTMKSQLAQNMYSNPNPSTILAEAVKLSPMAGYSSNNHDLDKYTQHQNYQSNYTFASQPKSDHSGGTSKGRIPPVNRATALGLDRPFDRNNQKSHLVSGGQVDSMLYGSNVNSDSSQFNQIGVQPLDLIPEEHLEETLRSTQRPTRQSSNEVQNVFQQATPGLTANHDSANEQDKDNHFREERWAGSFSTENAHRVSQAPLSGQRKSKLSLQTSEAKTLAELIAEQEMEELELNKSPGPKNEVIPENEPNDESLDAQFATDQLEDNPEHISQPAAVEPIARSARQGIAELRSSGKAKRVGEYPEYTSKRESGVYGKSVPSIQNTDQNLPPSFTTLQQLGSWISNPDDQLLKIYSPGNGSPSVQGPPQRTTLAPSLRNYLSILETLAPPRAREMFKKVIVRQEGQFLTGGLEGRLVLVDRVEDRVRIQVAFTNTNEEDGLILKVDSGYIDGASETDSVRDLFVGYQAEVEATIWIKVSDLEYFVPPVLKIVTKVKGDPEPEIIQTIIPVSTLNFTEFLASSWQETSQYFERDDLKELESTVYCSDPIEMLTRLKDDIPQIFIQTTSEGESVYWLRCKGPSRTEVAIGLWPVEDPSKTNREKIKFVLRSPVLDQFVSSFSSLLTFILAN